MADVVRVVEVAGAGIMVLGGVAAFVASAARWRSTAEPYSALRRRLGRVILLGLEVMIIGDIVRTLTVEPTLSSVAVLAAIVLIRIVLSFSIEIEIEGVWPWRQGSPQRSEVGRHDPDPRRSA